MFERFNEGAIATVMIARQEALKFGQGFVGPEMLLIGIMAQNDDVASPVLDSVGVTLEKVKKAVEQSLVSRHGRIPDQIPFNLEAKQILEISIEEANHLEQAYVGPEHILLAMVHNPENAAARILTGLQVDLNEVRQGTIWTISEGFPELIAVGQQKAASDTLSDVLLECVTDLTQLASQGKIDPVIGREKEIQRMIQVLGRRRKNNPVLLGEPGVGKTALAEGLAQRIVNQDVPEGLMDKRVLSLNVASLVAGTRFRGEFEERLKQLISEVQEAGNIILLIDEIHTLVGAGGGAGGMDAANMLKPALARGELQCIGATTLSEYRKYIEKDAALERRFQPIVVNEPSIEETIEILRGVRVGYEQHHQLIITDQAIEAAAKFASRYIPDRYLPDKAIDLIDEAGSRVHLSHPQEDSAGKFKRSLRQIASDKAAAIEVQDFSRASKLRGQELVVKAELQRLSFRQDRFEQLTVEDKDIAQVVAAWTGIPVGQMTHAESATLMHLEEKLHQRLIGQKDAVQSVSKAVRRAKVGLNDSQRPIASFIFCGPTGVGKTELTKALADVVFGSEDALIRLDMSEYMESQSVSKMIGSPPGYVGYGDGGQLTEAVRRKPYAVLLFDEIEKAHPDVFNLLLQLLDDGRLTDSQGRVVDFKNTLVIMTSNIGSRSIEKSGSGLGFDIAEADLATAKYKRTREQVNEALKLSFRPEFLNRLDEIVVFHQLTCDQVKQISVLLLEDVSNRLADRRIKIELTETFKERLIDDGYNPSYGARPLRRAITRLVEDNLAKAILAGEIHEGETVVLDINSDGQVTVRAKEVRILSTQLTH